MEKIIKEVAFRGSFADFSLKDNDLKGWIRPVFDILWSKEVSDSSLNPSPLDCFTQGVMIKTLDRRYQTVGGWEGATQECVTISRAPVLGQSRAGEWSCRTINPKSQALDFTAQYNSITNSNTTVSDGWTCRNTTLSLDSEIVKQQSQSCTGRDCSCNTITESIVYKSIPSYILHTSPTDEEFGAQINSRFTPSLPIDSDRYIDFIGAAGGAAPSYGYQRIDFPQLFRVESSDADNLSLENIKEATKEYLDDISDQINASIRNSDPSSLSGEEREIFDILTTGDFPSATIDLYASLADKPLEVFTLQNESKEISYLDTLIFSIYWNNLDSVASKYKFIFEEYLSNQFEGNDYNFHLPKSKKSYEIAYFAAPGDAQNMYVKLDPELKGIHPYADIISQYIALNTTISWANVGDQTEQEWTFECAPPDGVNIFQWIPAVICWLTEMLPPTIKISSGSCWEDLNLSDEEREEIINGCKDDVELIRF